MVRQPDDEDKHRLVAASLCSPSNSRREEKLGATMAEVHRLVPRVNDEISDQIDRLFARLPDDRFTQRFNWPLMPRCDLVSRDKWQLAPGYEQLRYRVNR